MLGERIGNWLSWQRLHTRFWGRVALAFLAILVLLNVAVLRPPHPHFALESFPGFWAGFGLVFALAMILALKKVVAKIIGVSEDFHDRDK